MGIGQKIKELRMNQKIKQENLANLLNTTQDTISLWEKEKRTPSAENIIMLSKYFNVSTDYLLGLENEDGTKTYNIENNSKFINSFNNISNCNNNKIN
jgi:transcriptional regulator with XRE-family HTH domain